MLWRRLPAGGEPWKFEGMWYWFFLKLCHFKWWVSSSGRYLRVVGGHWCFPFLLLSHCNYSFSFYIRLSFEIDAHALMNEREKGRDTENYDETSKMGPPFSTLCYFFVLLFFAVHLDNSQ